MIQRVWVRVGTADEEQPALAVGWDGPDLLVAAPDIAAPSAGSHVVVAWPTTTGLSELMGRVSEVTRARWRVRPVGTAARVQRRAYTRTSLASIVSLAAPVGDLRAVVIDISESGMRCVVRGHADFEIGTTVTTTLDLDGDEVDVTATLLRLRHTPPGRSELAFSFVDLHWRDGDRIRKFVFSRQVRTRAMGER